MNANEGRTATSKQSSGKRAFRPPNLARAVRKVTKLIASPQHQARRARSPRLNVPRTRPKQRLNVAYRAGLAYSGWRTRHAAWPF